MVHWTYAATSKPIRRPDILNTVLQNITNSVKERSIRSPKSGFEHPWSLNMCYGTQWPIFVTPHCNLHSLNKIDLSVGGLSPDPFWEGDVSFMKTYESMSGPLHSACWPNAKLFQWVGRSVSFLAFWHQKSETETRLKLAKSFGSTPVHHYQLLLLGRKDNLHENWAKKAKYKENCVGVWAT